jgi:hypothetical protein
MKIQTAYTSLKADSKKMVIAKILDTYPELDPSNGAKVSDAAADLLEGDKFIFEKVSEPFSNSPLSDLEL